MNLQKEQLENSLKMVQVEIQMREAQADTHMRAAQAVSERMQWDIDDLELIDSVKDTFKDRAALVRAEQHALFAKAQADGVLLRFAIMKLKAQEKVYQHAIQNASQSVVIPHGI
jgi:hypothetical protein